MSEIKICDKLNEFTANQLLRDIDVLHQVVQSSWKDWPSEKVDSLIVDVKRIVRRYCDI